MVMNVVTTCPLCGDQMSEDNGRLICAGNHNHILSIQLEWNRYTKGEKDMNWLRSRIKIRMGKLIHRR